jgi:H+/Cl- antiporter ClcA
MAATTRVLERLFDIRNIVGALLAIYGVLLTIVGFAPGLLRAHHDPSAATNRTDLYVGTSANWWVGLVLVGVAIVFFTWALLRPPGADQRVASSAPDPEAGTKGARRAPRTR